MKLLRRLFWLPGSLFCYLMTTSPLTAQIVQDATLPNSSIVNSNGGTSVITGGTRAESNLFHSFREFSVPTNGVASFQQIDLGVANVISRVTGSSASNIDGSVELRGANGSVSAANLFLINPYGIIFGPNASLLNMGGSFVASTASSLQFADGNSFSATNAHTSALLTVSVPSGLQFGVNSGSIRNQSIALNRVGTRAGLRVEPGKTVALVGSQITLEGGITAAGGRIELGSVAAATSDLTPVQVSLTSIDKGWALGYEQVQNFQDIALTQQATVTASGSGGGDIQVQGRRVTLTEGARIITNTQGADRGGNLAVTASDSLEISGGVANRFSGLFAQVVAPATGTGGNLIIETRNLTVRDGAQVSTSTSGSGKAGNLIVRAADSVEVSGISDNLTSISSLGTTVQRGSSGSGGDVTIDTRQLIVRDGAQVVTSTLGAGKAGNLTVQNATQVELSSGAVTNGQFAPSGLTTTAEPGSTGAGGNLSLSAKQLIVREGAQVNSTTFGVGRAGNLTVQTTDVELIGAATSADELLTNNGLPFPSGLFAGTGVGSRGDGGDLSIATERLSLRDGAVVQTSTLGAGNAGSLQVSASESVQLTGTAAGNQSPTSLLAVSGGIPNSEFAGVTEATGQGGDLRIATGELIVQDGAAVAVSSLNPEPDAQGAGTLEIQARTVRLDNQGALTSATASGQGGDIDLQVQDLLLLRRNSDITSSAGVENAGGDGGNITIDTAFIVAFPSEDSDITANAFTGTGGRVQITAQGIFGTQYREQETLLSDITASSRFGVNGVVQINTPDVDLNRGLVNLPEAPVPEGLIAQGCPADRQNTFTITGRGGLPPQPSDAQRTSAIVVNGDSLEAATSTLAQVVEAQGWLVNTQGQVVLTASAPVVTLNTRSTTLTCYTP